MISTLIGAAGFFLALRAGFIMRENDNFWEYILTCAISITLTMYAAAAGQL